MPEKLETKLMSQAANIGLTGERAKAYRYGTLQKAGFKPERKRESKQGHNITKNLGY